MLKYSIEDAVVEDVVELVKDYFEDWNSVIVAIEDYSEERKTSGIFDKGKTWLMITLIATLLGITTTEVMANPSESVEKLTKKIHQEELAPTESIELKKLVEQYKQKLPRKEFDPYMNLTKVQRIGDNTYFTVTFFGSDIDTMEQQYGYSEEDIINTAKEKIKFQYGMSSPTFVGYTSLGMVFAENEQAANLIREKLKL